MPSYILAGKHIVSQEIADEVIIVDLKAGSYFSLMESASVIWRSVLSGASKETIIEQLRLQFHETETAIAPAVEDVLQQLLSDGVIVIAQNTDANDAITNLAEGQTKSPFTSPVIQKYTDMQDVLMLDPIHDFDDAGWPNVSNAPVAVQ